MIAIKPHHFVDIVTALGAGQTTYEAHPYGHALHTVANAILANRDVMLRIEIGADDICLPCRHNVNGACDDTLNNAANPKIPRSKGEYNLMLDQRWSERLGITQGDEMTARDLCVLISTRMGDISDIYREIAPEAVVKRHAELTGGIRAFLAQRAA